MLLRYFYDPKLAQASYLVGCSKTGEALVVDPARAIEPYLQLAKQEGLRITHVTETHIHADFVSGSRELAAATGAALYLSDEGDADWKYQWGAEYDTHLVRDGDCWMVGNVRLQVQHTPGHTPEHICFLLTDTAGSERPMGLFTGDFIFVGDVGRPDLLEEAAGLVGSKLIGARAQFHSLQRSAALPDYLQIWPGHGAGSACGKALGAVPTTTFGYERLVNPAFHFESEQPFVEWLLEGQPEAPRYFAQMKRVNKQGPALLSTLAAPAHAARPQLDAALAAGAQVFDLRAREAFAAAHLPGTINIPATSNSWSTWAGWLVDYGRPLHLVLPAEDARDELLRDLRAIGVDDIAAVYAPEVAQGSTQSLAVIHAGALAQAVAQTGALLLDVRGRSEYAEGHLPEAKNIPLGYLPRQMSELEPERPVIALCASGYRAHIAASLLQAAGFARVTVLDGSPVA